jgi:putative transposase
MTKNDTESFSKELLDQLLTGRDPKMVLDSGGLVGDLRYGFRRTQDSNNFAVHARSKSRAPSALRGPSGAIAYLKRCQSRGR